MLICKKNPNSKVQRPDLEKKSKIKSQISKMKIKSLRPGLKNERPGLS